MWGHTAHTATECCEWERGKRRAAVRNLKCEGKFCRKSIFLGREAEERAPAADSPTSRFEWRAERKGKDQEKELHPGSDATRSSCLPHSCSNICKGRSLPGEGKRSIQNLPHSWFQCLPQAAFQGDTPMLPPLCVVSWQGWWEMMVLDQKNPIQTCYLAKM